MKKLLALLSVCHVAGSVKHSLKFFLTATSGVRDIPEFMGSVLVDEVQSGYYDSNIRTAEIKLDWMRKFMKENPQQLEFYVNECNRLQHFLRATIDSLMKRLNQTEDLPSVSLLQKTPSSPVSCHATGFYRNRADLFWRKDGEEIHEDVDKGEILPNHDGTFQMSVDLNISLIAPEDWKKYDCVFQMSGAKDNIITKLDKSVIRSNWVSPSGFPAGVVIGVVVGLLLLLLCIAGLFIWRKKTPQILQTHIQILTDHNSQGRLEKESKLQ